MLAGASALLRWLTLPAGRSGTWCRRYRSGLNGLRRGGLTGIRTGSLRPSLTNDTDGAAAFTSGPGLEIATILSVNGSRTVTGLSKPEAAAFGAGEPYPIELAATSVMQSPVAASRKPLMFSHRSIYFSHLISLPPSCISLPSTTNTQQHADQGVKTRSRHFT